MTDNKVIDIYDWHRPGPKVCALVELSTPTETKRKLRLSKLALAGTLVVLVSLLIASYV